MNSSFIILGIYGIDILILAYLATMGWKAMGFGLVTNLVLVTITAQKQIVFFGLESNFGCFPYAAVTFAISVCADRHGIVGCMRLLNAAFFSLLLTLVTTNLLLYLPIIEGNDAIHNALAVIFKTSLQIGFASFLAFYSAQSLNVVLINRLHLPQIIKKPIASTITQFVDSLFFFQIAFFGIWEEPTIILAAFSGFLIKSILNILDTPAYLFASRFHRSETL